MGGCREIRFGTRRTEGGFTSINAMVNDFFHIRYPDASSGSFIPGMANAAAGDLKSPVEINASTANGPVLSDNDRFGSSVADIGHLDGDGVADLAQ